MPRRRRSYTRYQSMHTDHFIQNLEKRANKNGLKFKVRKPAIESAIVAFEERNRITMPQQVKLFYLMCNGLKVAAPSLEIKSIEELNIDEMGKIIFAVIDKRHRICFDVSKNNATPQWAILNYDTGFIVTLTMASFWTNKIFAWLDKRRTIWKEETY
jgi:hypothetical protein